MLTSQQRCGNVLITSESDVVTTSETDVGTTLIFDRATKLWQRRCASWVSGKIVHWINRLINLNLHRWYWEIVPLQLHKKKSKMFRPILRKTHFFQRNQGWLNKQFLLFNLFAIEWNWSWVTWAHDWDTAQKTKFSIKDFFSKVYYIYHISIFIISWLLNSLTPGVHKKVIHT